MKLTYYEECMNEEDARQRKRYLKTVIGKKYLKIALRNISKICKGIDFEGIMAQNYNISCKTSHL